MSTHRCRVCGCTDYSTCIEPDGFPCCWVERDLCSRCAYHPGNGVVELPQGAGIFPGKEDQA